MTIATPPAKELAGIELLWDALLAPVYARYPEAADYRVRLAAALVEVAVRLQRLGGEAAGPGDLLAGDLCLARASRLLADAGDQRLQVAFARAVETVSGAAAAGHEVPEISLLLRAALEARA
jgi:hypothetical protein